MASCVVFNSVCLLIFFGLVGLVCCRCTQWGLSSLWLWFSALQEAIDIVAVIYGKDMPETNEFSLTIANMPTTSRSNGLVTTIEEESQLIDVEHEQDTPTIPVTSMTSTIFDVIAQMINAAEIAVWDAAL
jgi:hypothetical protein